MSGSTHGEKKESRPAMKAAGKCTVSANIILHQSGSGLLCPKISDELLAISG